MKESHKRYLVFIYPNFYPDGGMNDFMDSFDSIPDAVEYIKENFSWYNYDVYDRIDGVSIETSDYGL